MKGRILVVGILVAAGLVAFLNGSLAQAPAAPQPAAAGLFSEINSGDLEAAMALFAGDAVATDRVRGKTYHGAAEIQAMLEGMHREGRRLEIVRLEEVGSQIRVTAEISDDGLVWGTEWMLIELKNGKIQSYELSAVRLKF